MQKFVTPRGFETESNELNINIPDVITKQLKMRDPGNGSKRITVSSNWLRLFDFEPEDAVVERSLGQGKGMVIERVYDLFNQPRTKKVYSRTYKSRKNNPIESVLEVSSQKIINESFPADCQRVHVTFEKGRVTLTPITTAQDKALNNAKTAEDKLSAFCAFSSGVDAYELDKAGFKVTGMLEFRPQEARDKRDFTETGALTALSNLPDIKALFNEDVFSLDLDKMVEHFAQSPFMLLHACPQCDDFSTLKNNKQKEKDICDTSSTMDMTLDVINMIEKFAVPVVMLENVSGWSKSAAYELMSLRLRRRGYREHLLQGADARDYGGLTSRKRSYAVFTALDSPFEFESPQPRRTTPIWDEIVPFLSECRDVTDNATFQKGSEVGRLRVINKDSLSSPTPVKSQARMAKDSLVIEHEGRRYWPTEELLKFLLGIDPNFDLSATSKTMASEVIGQSIDVPLHESVIRAVKKHIESFFGMGSESKGLVAA